jgi:hypothetical protein
MKIGEEQLKNIIATQIKKEGLDNLLDMNAIDLITDKIKAAYKKTSSPNPSVTSPISEVEVIPESSFASQSFPYEEEHNIESSSTSVATPPSIDKTVAGSVPTDTTYSPKVFTPELPDVLKNIEPAKIIVGEENELAESGEMLSNKPFRTYENLDSKLSMKQFWKEEGKTRAEVFLIKYEKIGEISYNYATGTSLYEPMPNSIPETTDDVNDRYRDNPYSASQSSGKIEIPTSEVENFIKTSVNIEDIVRSVAIEMMAQAYRENSNEKSKEEMGMSHPADSSFDSSIKPV